MRISIGGSFLFLWGRKGGGRVLLNEKDVTVVLIFGKSSCLSFFLLLGIEKNVSLCYHIASWTDDGTACRRL